MDRYFISHKTADEFYSSAEVRNGRIARTSRAGFAQSHVPDQRKTASLPECLHVLHSPMHLLVPNEGGRKVASNLTCHIWSRAIPEEAFVRVEDGVYACSPEFTFFQMAEYLSLHELIALGFEYCGTYSLQAHEKQCVFGVAPLTSAARLKRFVERLPSARHVEKARKAASLVRDGSASPMETALYMTMCLSRKMGGYALPCAILNYRVALNEKARKIYKREYCLCDLYFPEAGVDLEYDGRDYHFGKDASDRARAVALGIMGCAYVSVSAIQYRDEAALFQIARQIATMHGGYKKRNQGVVTQARYRLRKSLNAYLHGWNRT